jgi:hypothetical protein
MYRYIKGFMTPSWKLDVQFNPEMCQASRDATLYNQCESDPVGIRVSHPNVLLALRWAHLCEIRRQAALCGYTPTHIFVNGNTWSLLETEAHPERLPQLFFAAVGLLLRSMLWQVASAFRSCVWFTWRNWNRAVHLKQALFARGVEAKPQATRNELRFVYSGNPEQPFVLKEIDHA